MCLCRLAIAPAGRCVPAGSSLRSTSSRSKQTEHTFCKSFSPNRLSSGSHSFVSSGCVCRTNELTWLLCTSGHAPYRSHNWPQFLIHITACVLLMSSLVPFPHLASISPRSPRNEMRRLVMYVPFFLI